MATNSLPQTRNLTKEKLAPARLRPTNGRQGREFFPYPETERNALSSAATFGLFALALLTLELANAATTFWALDNLMGAAGAFGLSFAVMLTIGLGALDTGGLFRLFGPQADNARPFALWCVLLAWLLCATANAVLTWWAVSSAMAEHATGNVVLSDAQLLDVTPAALAVALWVIRILFVAGWANGERG